jgi:hypothetical protein
MSWGRDHCVDSLRSGVKRRVYYVGITVLAVIFAYALFFWGHQWFFWDAASYYGMAQLAVKGGFGGLPYLFSNDKTYGYPLFIAAIYLLTNHISWTVRFVIFNVQLAFFLISCLYAARFFRRILKTDGAAITLYAATALNPFLLIYTTEVLTDLISAVLVYLTVLSAIQLPSRGAEPSSENGGESRILKSGGLNRLLLFLSVGIRKITQPTSIAIGLGAVMVGVIIRIEGHISILSAILILLAVLFAIQVLWEKNESPSPILRNAFLTFLLAGMATMVRPSNVVIIMAVLLIWSLRAVVFRDMPRQAWLMMGIGLLIPFVPQLLFNFQYFNKLEPLVVSGLYSNGLVFGMNYLKVTGLVIPGEPAIVHYLNPFLYPGIATPIEFLINRPLGYLLTAAMHVFAMFDYDFLFPYVYDVHPWYQWPVSILNYTFLFLSGMGALQNLREVFNPWERRTLALMGLLIAVGGYVAVYMLSVVEARYSLPEYLLLSPFFVYGLYTIKQRVLNRERRWVATRSSGLILFLAASVALSAWMQTQVPELNAHEIPSPHAQLVKSVAAMIPDDAVVVAQPELVSSVVGKGTNPLISDRETIYQMRNPTTIKDGRSISATDRASILGNTPVPCWNAVDYLFADRSLDYYQYQAQAWEYLLTPGLYTPVIDREGVILAKRAELERSLQARFGDRLQWVGYAFDSAPMRQGENQLRLVVGWKGNGTSIDSYDVEMRLVDREDHLWGQGSRDEIDKSCPSEIWEKGSEVRTAFVLNIPPTMPPGEYRITVALRDRKEGRYLPVSDASGKMLGDALVIPTPPITKNTTSVTASELQIEQPYFVDMQEMRLLGMVLPRQTAAPGEHLQVGLYWRARGQPLGDYWVAVQLRTSTGHVAFEQKDRPSAGAYPTTKWKAGEVLLDWHDFDLPQDIPIGDYGLFVSLLDTSSQRILGEARISTLAVAR